MTVHYLEAGRAICGAPGLPCEWPVDDRFVSAHDGVEGLRSVNCHGCRAALVARTRPRKRAKQHKRD